MKKKEVIVVLVLILILLMIFMLILYKNNKEFEENSKKIYSENIKGPDRIIYKPSKEDKYYEILPNEDLYSKIIDELSKNIGDLNENQSISQNTIDDIEDNNAYIQFDYNQISKNYIFLLDKDDIGTIKLKSEGGTLLSNNVRNVKSMQKMIDKAIKKDNKKFYTMGENKEYVSINILDSFPYRYKNKFESTDYMIYQKVITNWEEYDLYSEMCNLQFTEPLPENIFENNNLILTVSIPKDIQVKISVGNLKYTYSTAGSNYHFHLLVVSKIVNSNCIYNTNNVIKEQQEELEEFHQQFNEKVDNIDKEKFVTNFEEYFSNRSESTTIKQSETEEIADIAFEEASRIAGSYEKETQTVETKKIYANNFFTFKNGEASENYGVPVEAYVYRREDDLGNGIEIYIDKCTGKIIGGSAFGD